MKRCVRTIILTSILLLAVSVAAQANNLYDFGSTVTYGCDGSGAGCTGGSGPGGSTGAGTATLINGSTPGGATLYTTPDAVYIISVTNGDVSLAWYGSGDGTVPTSIPVSWDFSITDVGVGTTVNWELQYVLGDTPQSGGALPTGGTPITVASAIGQSQGSTISGVSSVNPGGLAGTTMGNWEVLLTVFPSSTSGGNNTTVTVPLGSGGIDLGSSVVPEPGTWSMAGGGLLFALMAASRKLRRR